MYDDQSSAARAYMIFVRELVERVMNPAGA